MQKFGGHYGWPGRSRRGGFSRYDPEAYRPDPPRSTPRERFNPFNPQETDNIRRGLFDMLDAMDARRDLARYGLFGTPGRVPRIKWAGRFAQIYAVKTAFDQEWGKIGPGRLDYNLPGWTTLCSTPFLNPYSGLGVSPAPPGLPSVSGGTCGAGVSNSINLEWGAPIPAGTTFVQIGDRNHPYVRGAPNPEGTRNMNIRRRQSLPSGAPSIIQPTSPNGMKPVPITPPSWEPETRDREYGRGRSSGKLPSWKRRALTRTILRRRPLTWDVRWPEATWRPSPEINPEVLPGKPGTPHWRLPPAPGDKETKVKVPYGWLGKGYGGLTEIKDVIDCISGAQQQWRRYGRLWTKVKDPCKGLPLHKKAMCIWQHLDSTDWAAAVECFGLNQISDKAIGQLSSGADDNIRKSPYASQRPGGYGRGGGSWALRMR